VAKYFCFHAAWMTHVWGVAIVYVQARAVLVLENASGFVKRPNHVGDVAEGATAQLDR
jgi:hypothetical protein